MSIKEYFAVERSDGQKPTIIDWIGAFIMGVILTVFVLVPYILVILVWMAILAVYFNVKYWITGEVEQR